MIHRLLSVKLAEGGRTESFLGVPFAQPPVGDLRWAPPQPLAKPSAIPQANEFAAACMQGDHIAKWYKNVASGFGGDPDLINHPKVSEDCLYLNIWRPATDGSKVPHCCPSLFISMVAATKVVGLMSLTTSATTWHPKASSLSLLPIGWACSGFSLTPHLSTLILDCWIKSLRCSGSMRISSLSGVMLQESQSWESPPAPIILIT